MRFILVVCILLSPLLSCSQQYQTYHGLVSFFAEAPIENIAATNKNVIAFIDLSTGEITGQLAIAHFEFKKSLMKTHFNEKYMESEQFPEADFQGRISGYQPMQPGQQRVTANGKLTIHGQTRELELPMIMTIDVDRITMSGICIIKIADYGIQAPKLFWKTITEEVEVKAAFIFYLPGKEQ